MSNVYNFHFELSDDDKVDLETSFFFYPDRSKLINVLIAEANDTLNKKDYGTYILFCQAIFVIKNFGIPEKPNEDNRWTYMDCNMGRISVHYIVIN